MRLRIYIKLENLKITRARLFKTNDVFSYWDVKISNINISNMPIFFVDKM